jgi:hypothetical protein
LEISLQQWRVTRYDPRLRNRQGQFRHDTWSAASDIGQVFEGRVLTTEDYLTVEDAYVDAVVSFLRESGLAALSVVSLEISEDNWADRDPLHGLGIEPGFSIATGQVLSKKRLTDACRLTLREAIWCRLEEPGQFFVHFGYDYYMYIGSLHECPMSIAEAASNGLFIEHMSSPYLQSK